MQTKEPYKSNLLEAAITLPGSFQYLPESDIDQFGNHCPRVKIQKHNFALELPVFHNTQHTYIHKTLNILDK